jgi:hypothetical protein
MGGKISLSINWNHSTVCSKSSPGVGPIRASSLINVPLTDPRIQNSKIVTPFWVNYCKYETEN